MTDRIIARSQNSGRTDDNLESLKKRFRVFEKETLPVIEYYSKQDKVVRVSKCELCWDIDKWGSERWYGVERTSRENRSIIKELVMKQKHVNF